jgi:hypothetical protein
VTAVGRRWSLSGQLLALQLVIVGVVLVGVARGVPRADGRLLPGRRRPAGHRRGRDGRRHRAAALGAGGPGTRAGGSEGDGADDDLTLIRIVAESARN